MCGFRHRPGISLVELLLFLGIFATVIGTLLPFAFFSTENRQLQQTMAIVENNGAQMMQVLQLKIRDAEQILYPAAGKTGSLLKLQSASGSLNPTIVASSSGALFMIQRATKTVMSSTQVSIEKFVVHNTSTSSGSQSVQLSFTVSRTIRLQNPRRYARHFETVMGLLPDDRLRGTSCNFCQSDGCNVAQQTYQWATCTAGDGTSCGTASTSMKCP